MSPRRRIPPGGAAPFTRTAATPRQRWPLLLAAATLLMVGAIAVCTVVLVSHESHRRQLTRDAWVLDDVRSFMTTFTSPDPFHANDYVERVLERSTGEFARQYQEKANQALLRVARSEPTTGSVLEAGVERWNDDGTANVLVATGVSSKPPAGAEVVDVVYRWLVTAKQEGAQWKISSLVQVI